MTQHKAWAPRGDSQRWHVGDIAHLYELQMAHSAEPVRFIRRDKFAGKAEFIHDAYRGKIRIVSVDGEYAIVEVI